jgi:uncharacterized cofD-like protein
MLNVVLFCGGSGSSSLVKELANHSDSINTTLIINPFDDGKSTGRLRDAIPGLPGISDFRKNIVNSSSLDSAQGLNTRVDDFAVGNGLIASLFLATGSFQAAVDEAVRLFKVPIKILSVTENPATLAATLDSGEILGSEAEIVDYSGESKIFSLLISGLDDINQDCVSAIAEADLIIFGAGTQHSSLLPTYLSLSGLININDLKAKKYLVVNLEHEGDTKGWTTKDLVKAAASYWKVENIQLDSVIVDPRSKFADNEKEYSLCADAADSTKHDGIKLLTLILDKFYSSKN